MYNLERKKISLILLMITDCNFLKLVKIEKLKKF